jgi:hypothetical protein
VEDGPSLTQGSTLYSCTGRLPRTRRLFLSKLDQGITGLNQYLSRIGVIDEAKRSCGNDEETIRHLLLSCPRWTDERGGLCEIVGHRSRDVPYLLEGWGAREVVRMGYTQSRPDKAPYLTYALRVTSSLNMHNSTATHALYLRPITLSSWTTYASVECEKGINSAWMDCTRGLEVDGFVRVARPTVYPILLCARISSRGLSA